MADFAALGVAAAEAERIWPAIRDNVARRSDIAVWVGLIREGAAPLIAPEDEAFVAEALALLPPPPWGETAWADWTAAVKAATGRKGKALFLPLRKALTGGAMDPIWRR
ncbi:MAG: hypothetical protein JKP98_13880 [Rhodobacteraceae bacterium]|nr:hypothetical protein [Paracoccaceae bacterium]